MDNAKAAAKPELTTQQSNDTASQNIAKIFLQDISTAMKPTSGSFNWTNEIYDYGARNTLNELTTNNDPLRGQVLDQIANDVNNKAFMSSLGLTCSLGRDPKTGEVQTLVFNSSAMSNLYQSNLSDLAGQGYTPTEAAARVSGGNTINDRAEQGQITINVNDTGNYFKPAAPTTPVEVGGEPSGIGGITIN